MTIDERLEFLVQSTESLHATVMEHSRQIMQHDAQIAVLIGVGISDENRWLRIMRVLRDALNAGLNGDGQEGEDK